MTEGVLRFTAYHMFEYRDVPVVLKHDDARGIWTWKVEFSRSDIVRGEVGEWKGPAESAAKNCIDRRRGVINMGGNFGGGGNAA